MGEYLFTSLPLLSPGAQKETMTAPFSEVARQRTPIKKNQNWRENHPIPSQISSN